MVFALWIGFELTYSAKGQPPKDSVQAISKGPTDIAGAIAALRQKSAWSYLPDDLEERVRNQALSGRELNVKVDLVDDEGVPVPGALCAIVEDSSERSDSYGMSWLAALELDSLPLAIGATDKEGIFEFKNVRGGYTNANLSGIVQAFLVVLHPEYGMRTTRLLLSNRPQFTSMKLSSGKTLTGTVVNLENEPIPNVFIEFGIFKKSGKGIRDQSEFDTSSILAPQVWTGDDGHFVLEGLPPGDVIAIAPRSKKYEVARHDKLLKLRFIPTETGHLDIVVEPSGLSEIVFKCVDATGKETPPLPRIGFGKGVIPDVDTDGFVVTRPYPRRNQGYDRNERYDLEINMPSPWVSLRDVRLGRDFKEPFEVSVVRGRIVRGKVVDAESGKPIGGIRVEGYESDGYEKIKAQVEKKAPWVMLTTSAHTNSNGEFVLVVSDTQWSIQAHIQMLNGYGQFGKCLSTEVPAGRSPPEEIVFRVSAAGKLRGVVLSENGTPIPNVLVSVYTEETNSPRIESVAFSNALGEFALFPPITFFPRYTLHVATENGEVKKVFEFKHSGQTMELRIKTSATK